MRLTIQQCIERIKNPKNGTYLRQARLQEERLIMHCEPILDPAPVDNALTDWKNWVRSFLPADKFKRFEQLIRFPLPTVNTTKVIWDELSKIFDAPDKSVRVEFTVPEMEEDFWNYIEEGLNDENFWTEKGWKAVKTRPCSFVVTDLPARQRDIRPEPYYYLLSASAVWDVDVNPENNKVECIFIRQGAKQDTILAIDDNAYRVFVRPENSAEWFLKDGYEARHSWYNDSEGVEGTLIDGLGYTPVCPFWEFNIEGTNGINKDGPITSSLSDLDWLLFWAISKKYLDLYGAWPIVLRYREECTYQDRDGHTCDHGWLRYQREDPNAPEGWRKCADPCPECAKNSLIGPGSELVLDPPKRDGEVELIENYVKFVEASNDKLEYGVSELERLTRVIQVNATGRIIQEATKEAINEDQVRSQFEAQAAKMNIISKQIASTRQFALTTVARLRYGPYFLRGSVFMGQEYFLRSADDLSEQYATTKKNGLPEYEVDRVREAYSNTKFKSDDLERQRSRILAELYPYPNLTANECRALGIEAMDPKNFLIKINFTTLIKRFERENVNIVEFGSLVPFNVKINIIHQQLLSYVNDIKPAPSPQPDNSGNGRP